MRHIRKMIFGFSVRLLLTFFVVFSFSCTTVNGSCCFIEKNTGRILFSENEHDRLPMASTTKVMSALIALEGGNCDMLCKVSENAAMTEGSSAYLKPGDMVSLFDLVVLCLMRSGNDAAVAIAEAVGVNEEGFAAMMNKRAEAMGLSDTHFKNAHGLDEPQHYSSAFDLAVLFSVAMDNPDFAAIVSASSAEVIVSGKRQIVYNKTAAANTYEYAVAAKNGYTELAGRCLVSMAQKNGMLVCGAVLNAGDMYMDSEKYFESCFEEYSLVRLFSAGEYLRTIALFNSELDNYRLNMANDVMLPLKKGEEALLNSKHILTDSLSAPQKKGSYIGRTEIYLGEERLCFVEHYTQYYIEEKKTFLPIAFGYFKFAIDSIF